ncbi:DUF6174 domain-containing protein [Nocardioides conyzicola]|uniref:Secreted protein n=1 Tax=Nocardioides conyzicola TaxID=1651781 RepID=A0ABP8X5N3_9ACTN
MSRKVWIAGAALVAAIVAVVVSTHLDDWAAARAHGSAQRLWESREPTTYSFDYTACSGMCEPCHAHITVTDGEVTSVAGGGGCRGLDRDSAPTIDTIFEMEERDRSAEMTDSFEIRYDPTWGFPASVVLHCPPETSDCGTSYEVTGFRER